jgi:hypothetical protein
VILVYNQTAEEIACKFTIRINWNIAIVYFTGGMVLNFIDLKHVGLGSFSDNVIIRLLGRVCPVSTRPPYYVLKYVYYKN